MTADEELAIIRKVLDGDADAFESLVLANQKNVYNLALKMTGSQEDSADISQEAFFRAYRRLKSYRGDSRFSVWLYRLTYNLCVDHLRKKPREAAVSLINPDDGDEPHDIEIPDLRGLPEDIYERKETEEAIAKSIDGLSRIHREIIVMRGIEDMSYGEIAETLGISEGTVKSRLARARLSLAANLTANGTFPDGLRPKSQREEAGNQ